MSGFISEDNVVSAFFDEFESILGMSKVANVPRALRGMINLSKNKIRSVGQPAFAVERARRAAIGRATAQKIAKGKKGGVIAKIRSASWKKQARNPDSALRGLARGGAGREAYRKRPPGIIGGLLGR